MPDRCAPTTAMAISSPLTPAGKVASGGCGRLRLPIGKFGVGMEDAADAGKLRVLAGGRQQRDAERNVVGPHRRRQREAAEIEQIDEIGVGAEPAVEFDRIGQHLRGRVGGRRGRQHQRVDIGEGALGDAAQRLQPIQRGKGIGGGEPRAGSGDLARHRDGSHPATTPADRGSPDSARRPMVLHRAAARFHRTARDRTRPAWRRARSSAASASP